MAHARQRDGINMVAVCCARLEKDDQQHGGQARRHHLDQRDGAAAGHDVHRAAAAAEPAVRVVRVPNATRPNHASESKLVTQLINIFVWGLRNVVENKLAIEQNCNFDLIFKIQVCTRPNFSLEFKNKVVVKWTQ